MNCRTQKVENPRQLLQTPCRFEICQTSCPSGCTFFYDGISLPESRSRSDNFHLRRVFSCEYVLIHRKKIRLKEIDSSINFETICAKSTLKGKFFLCCQILTSFYKKVKFCLTNGESNVQFLCTAVHVIISFQASFSLQVFFFLLHNY